jgi:hypothetical protein
VLLVQGVEDADGIGLVGELDDVCLSGPAEGRCLVARAEVSPGDLAPEDEGDDPARHVLVNAGERDGLDVEPGFLADFPAQPVVDGLAQFQSSIGAVVPVAAGLKWPVRSGPDS